MKKILNIVIVLLTALLISWLIFLGHIINITNTNEASYCRWYDLYNDVFTREPVGIIRDYPWILVQCYDSKGDIQNAVATATIWNMVEDQGCPVVILHIDCNACTMDQGFTATPYPTCLPCITPTIHPTKIKPTVVTPERTPTPGLPTTVVPTDVPTSTPSIEPTQTPTTAITTVQPSMTATWTPEYPTATLTSTPIPSNTPEPTPTESTECYQWLCHKPDTHAEQDYCCDSPGCVAAHLKHGDYLGKCTGE